MGVALAHRRRRATVSFARIRAKWLIRPALIRSLLLFFHMAFFVVQVMLKNGNFYQALS